MRGVVAAIVLLTASSAHADPTSASRLEAAGGTMSWSYVPAGQHERFAHAEMLVAAPIDLVRAQATDFAHYQSMSNGRIQSSRLVDRRPGTTDVYLRVPVLNGMVTLWQVLRFTDLQRAADGTESFRGTLVHGNVRSAEMAIRMRPVHTTMGAKTIIECDLLVTPSFIAPQSAVDHELRDAAVSTVHAFGNQAEQKYAQLTPSPPPPTAVAMTAVDAGAP
jgi:hypothetical protein